MTLQASEAKEPRINRLNGDNWLSPIGPIGLIAHNLSPDFADSLNFYLRSRRAEAVARNSGLGAEPGYYRLDYRFPVHTPRFASGEGKAILPQSVRGHDLFIITDVMNDSCTYRRNGRLVTLSPDEQYQDLIRIILAISGKAKRINLVMPYLYEGRQYKRMARESLDGAAMLQRLFGLGIENLITFDAHDARIANAVPTRGLENVPCSYQLIEALLRHVPDLDTEPGRLMIVSPDESGVSRAVYFATLLEAPLGIFYRRRDYQRTVDGSYPIIGQQFLGDDVNGRDILIVDDMIVTGETLLRVAKALKDRGARRVFCAVTFAQFSHGLAETQAAYSSGVFDRVFATDLTYRRPELRAAPWFVEVGMARFTALLFDAVNHDTSLSGLIAPAERIQRLLAFHRRRRSHPDGATPTTGDRPAVEPPQSGARQEVNDARTTTRE